ncbi:hypothetical protein [Pumilibacter muris]|uniref:hypothetical protein n=1 Tax=Pumilibacter muris TaxID=2941510 RepID=UPI00203D14D5|nr:hypothetical protein [Pumilibacter muris]
MTNKLSAKSFLIALLAFCLFVSVVYGGWQSLPAYAEERVYTNVLADLQKDEMFNVINYPEIDDPANDLFGVVQVIQIAESASGELYLYTYQPSNKAKQLTATEVNMSLSKTVDGTSLFPLTLLNANGVFCKYLVGGIIVSNDDTRYYNISSIYRDWDKDIDGETGNDNTKNAVSFEVGKVYKVETEDGDAKYSCEKIDVIEILNPFAGFLSYYDGLHWDFLFNVAHYTDVHYIAFDTDFPIDTLQEADISYYTQSYTRKSIGGRVEWSYGDRVQQPKATIKGEQTGENAGDGFLGVKYTWKRIQSTEDFKKTVELTSEAQTEIDKTKWVLVFLETPFTQSEVATMAGHEKRQNGTKVSEVTILRLQFVTAGKHYNLGTVSDKITEGDKPSGGAPALGWLDLLCKWLEQVTGVPAWVWKIVICLLPLVIVLPILAAIFPIVGQVLAIAFKGIAFAFIWLFKGLWWLISLPFKGIAALVQKIKNKGGGGE